MFNCGLCLIVKDENQHLQEWLDFHLALGVEHAIIYDNNSQIPVTETLAPYIDRGLVTVHAVTSQVYCRQVQIYGDCLREHAKSFQWLGFIDTDEFIVPTTGSIPELLADYANYGGFCIPWLIYGSNGHLMPPREGVIKGYTKRSSEDFYPNRHVKTIVNCEHVEIKHAINPHCFSYHPGYYAVDENAQPVEKHEILNNRTYNRVRINHYFTRSRSDWLAKMQRGSAMGNHRTIEEFERYDCECTIEDQLAIVRSGSSR